MIPTLAPSLRLSLLAFRREGWLCAVGLLLVFFRRFAVLPAAWFGALLLVRAALASAVRHPLSPASPIEGALSMAGSGRFLFPVLGLWVCGALLAFLLRVAYVAGSVPVLGAAMAGRPAGSDKFVTGFAGGFAHLVPVACVSLALELSGLLFGATLGGTCLLLVCLTMGEAGAFSPGLAAATAFACTLALLAPLALSTAADGLLVRAALFREGPSQALHALTRRFLSRPGSFVLGAMLFLVLGLVVQSALQASGAVATGFARGAPAMTLAGPRLMLVALAALGATAVDLLWLGTLVVLCGGWTEARAVTSAASAGWRSSGPAA